MSEQLKEVVQRQTHEIETLQDNLSRVLNSVDKNTEVSAKLINQFSVYIQKHDSLEKTVDETRTEIKEIKKEQIEQGKTLESHKPVVDGFRTIAIRVLGTIVISMGAMTAIVVALTKGV